MTSRRTRAPREGSAQPRCRSLALEPLEDRTVLSLVAAYAFDEGTGTAASDSSGHGLTGTVSNAAWTADAKFGKALSFNGTNAWVTVADNAALRLTTGMTVEAWVKPTAITVDYRTVLLKERPGGLAYALYATDGANRPPAAYASIGGVDRAAIGTTTLAVNTWAHLAATYDGSNLRLYVNGTQVASRAQTGSMATSTSPLRIGGNSVWGEYFAGVIDEVRVYDTALSAAQIQADMTTPIIGTPDTTPPTVAVTAPADGSTVSGSVTVSADAADDVGVAGVQFKFGGSNLGAEDTTAPYTVSWATTAVANGTYQLTAVARDAAGNQTTSMVVSVTVFNTDTTPPTVALTAPASNATVTGSVSVTATASDDVGVAGVQFLLDGNPLGAEDTTAPYAVAWDTTAAANGSHVLAARARDAAGNTTTSAARTVTVSNTDPAVVGQWSAVLNWPLVAINSVLLKDGRVLMWDGGPACIGSSSARVWDPAANTFIPVPIPYFTGTDDDIFCSAQALLSDGRVLVVGGHDCDGPQLGIKMTNLFDPVTMTWTRGPDMAYRRWYPTATTLGDGRVLVTAGSVNTTVDYVPIPEIYDPVTNTWSTLTAASRTIPNYPFVFVNPDGRVIAAGSDESPMATSALDVATQTWTTIDPTVLDAGSGVMYRPGKVLKAGSSYLSPPADNGGGIPSSANTYDLDLTAGSPAWQQTASMATARTHLNLTVLPDGDVLATGGSTDIGGINPANAAYTTERWSPATRTWTTLAAAQRPRLYHSTALLLPDGRVLSAGGGHNYANSHAEFNAEIYSPAYLFKGPRPTVTSAPATVAYGGSFFVGTPNGAGIASVALIRNGSSTHAFNMDQRYVPLAFAQATDGLTVQAPLNGNVAPPGYYMLFLVDTNGVPSVAPFVQLPVDGQPPTAPGNLAAAAGVSSAALTWDAASDNVGVVGYQVHRGTTAGFTPSAANRVAQPTGTAYTDAGLAPGTYYYRVTARDGSGNVGPASNEASAAVAGDTTAPTVAVTAPAANATVSNTVTVTASASDDVGVAGVQFLLDGNPLGAEDTTAPYAVAWDTRGTANGSHTLTARARDAAGNLTASADVPVTVSNTAPPSNLVAAYGFEEGSGTTAGDVSGNGHAGTLSNATWVTTGKYGKALSFNGTNAWVTIADSNLLDLTTGMTLEAWVYPTAINSRYRTVLLKERPNGLAYSLYATNGANRPPAGYANIGGADRSAVGTANLAVNTWTHLATTYDGASLRLYVGGALVRTTAISGSILTSTGVLRIGGNSVWGEYFTGRIDEVRVYNRALSAAEITTDLNTPVGGGGGGLRLAAPARRASPDTVFEQLVPRVRAAAAARWEAAGLTGDRLRRLEVAPVRVADLPGRQLGFTAAGVIWLDRDAAGHGWFIDPTPADDREFPAAPGSPAWGKADLLTTLAHEMGHLLGLEHAARADDLMADEVPVGTRRVPAAVVAGVAADAGLAVALAQPARPRATGGRPDVRDPAPEAKPEAAPAIAAPREAVPVERRGHASMHLNDRASRAKPERDPFADPLD